MRFCHQIISTLSIFLLLNTTCVYVKEEKPYVTAFLNGQLGNQLFEIATAINLALTNNAEAIFPDLSKKNYLGIPDNRLQIFFRLNQDRLPRKIQYKYREPSHAYNPISFRKDMQLIGYFQSEKYFKENCEIIKELFSPSEEIKEYIFKKYEKIFENPCIVGVHVRTFKTDPAFDQWKFPFKGWDYFQHAMSLFPSDALFIVCSDQINRCKKKMKDFPYNILFIEGEKYWIDFFILSFCHHNIISNSTFSWWAAYLNPNPNKMVIAPKIWVAHKKIEEQKDIVPDSWLQLDY